mmetsp:Transcript_10172/g.13449  ORF Transcript_10172/g.13449 Transcript_10172/m.13449 type:complete len:104 (+) Transcript_10172:40-351(+)
MTTIFWYKICVEIYEKFYYFPDPNDSTRVLIYAWYPLKITEDHSEVSKMSAHQGTVKNWKEKVAKMYEIQRFIYAYQTAKADAELKKMEMMIGAEAEAKTSFP